MPTPIRTLFVTTYLGKGGAERFLATLLRFLDRSVIAPAVCALRDETGYPLPEDVPVTTLGWKRPWQLPSAVRRLRRVIEETHPQIVVGTVNATNIALGHALRGSTHRPKWIARIGNSPARDQRLLRSLAGRSVLSSADHWITCSKGLIAELAEARPASREKTQAIYNPVDFEEIERQAAEPPEISFGEQAPLIISIGRLAPQKRFDVLIDAFARLRSEVPAHLWVCGDGPDRASLQRQVDTLGISQQVRLTGFVANPFALMKQATIFALTSDFEGLPNALVEAQGLGLPAVSTRCPSGPDEVIEDGITGFLTPVGDVQAVADSMVSLLTDPGRLENMGLTARKKVGSQFAPEQQTLLWEQELRSVVPS